MKNAEALWSLYYCMEAKKSQYNMVFYVPMLSEYRCSVCFEFYEFCWWRFVLALINRLVRTWGLGYEYFTRWEREYHLHTHTHTVDTNLDYDRWNGLQFGLTSATGPYSISFKSQSVYSIVHCERKLTNWTSRQLRTLSILVSCYQENDFITIDQDSTF